MDKFNSTKEVMDKYFPNYPNYKIQDHFEQDFQQLEKDFLNDFGCEIKKILNKSVQQNCT
jgi:hypothetical protein